MGKRILLSLVLLVLTFYRVQADTTHNVFISSQKQFNSLADSIRRNITDGYKVININFQSNSTFYFNEKHIVLSNLKYKDVSISLNGNGTTIIAAGKDYTCDKKRKAVYQDEITSNSCFLTSDTKKEIAVHNDFAFAKNIIEVVDPAKKICRVYTGYKGSTEGMTIQVTASYKSYFCPVNYAKNGYLYFTDSSLTMMNLGVSFYSINHDYIYGKTYPRYRYFNNVSSQNIYCRNNVLYFPKGVTSLHECSASQFLYLARCNFKNLRITGFSFIGSNGHECFMYAQDIDGESIEISNCTFKYLKGDLLKMYTSSNLKFHDNSVSFCWSDGILIYNGCKNADIYNNSFSDMGDKMSSQYAVFCRGENYHIYNNTFKDFSYCAVRVGVHYSVKMTYPCSGVVENNEMFYTQDYLNNLSKHTLMDSGALYVSTQNTSADIRNNYIHDYSGMYDNRGIFCDDGTMNTTLSGNVISNIANCYTIDLRRTEPVDKYIPDCNDNDIMSGNLLDGPYKFQGRKSGNCKCSGNFTVSKNNSVKTIISDVKVLSKDIDVTDQVTSSPDFSTLKMLKNKYVNK